MSALPEQNPANGFGDAVATVESPEEPASEAVLIPSTRVTAILSSGNKQSALIDGKVVAVGELVDGHEVLEIRKDRVLLSPKQTSAET